MIKHIYINVAVVVLMMAGLPGVSFAEADGCLDGGGGAKDIDTLSASFDETSGYIAVVMTLCGDTDTDTDTKTKYRVHFDHTAPFAPDADRNGDSVINEADVCFTTSDDGMMHRGNRDNGPGQIMVVDNVLTYWVSKDELSLDLATGDTILLWADIQNKGIKDRAPDTNASDGCGEPEEAGEFIELVLAPPTGCLAGDRYEDRGDGTVLDCNTDLVWLKDASCAALPGTDGEGRANWFTADAAAAALADGTCGLTDGSSAGDWRQPTISEFCSQPTPSHAQCSQASAVDSLVDVRWTNPTLVNTAGTGGWIEGDPFVGVPNTTPIPIYWSATEIDIDTSYAWTIFLELGNIDDSLKTNTNPFVWPVRFGQ